MVSPLLLSVSSSRFMASHLILEAPCMVTSVADNAASGGVVFDGGEAAEGIVPMHFAAVCGGEVAGWG